MGLDLDKLKDKKARRATSGWSPKEGSNLIRILPHTAKYFTENISDFAFEFRSHYLKAEGADTLVVRCLKDKKETCAFCSAVQKFRESTNPKLKKNAEETRASERHLLNVIDLNDLPAGIQAFECGPMVYNGVLDYLANPAWGDLIDLKTGRNITLQLTPGAKSASGFNSYAVMPFPTQTDITPHLPADWKDKLDGLSASVPPYPEPAEILRWINVLGFADPTAEATPAAAPVPAPVTAASAPAPVVAPVVSTASAAPSQPVTAPVSTAGPAAPAPTGDPISVFAAANGLAGTKMVEGKSGVVPVCFSEGPSNKDVGFNPAKYPCEKGCPVRADCQLKQLGLA